MIDGFTVRSAQNPYNGRVEFYIVRQRTDGKTEMLVFGEIPMVYTLDELSEPKGPSFWLSHEAAASLAEELTRKGYKTSDYARLEGIIEAQKEHIADLRAILKLNTEA